MADEPPRKRQRTKEDVIGKDALTGDPATWKGRSLASVEQVPPGSRGYVALRFPRTRSLHAITPRAGAGAGAATAVRTAAGDACARA